MLVDADARAALRGLRAAAPRAQRRRLARGCRRSTVLAATSSPSWSRWKNALRGRREAGPLFGQGYRQPGPAATGVRERVQHARRQRPVRRRVGERRSRPRTIPDGRHGGRRVSGHARPTTISRAASRTRCARPTAKRSSSSAAVRSASAKASSSTTRACTPRGRCARRAAPPSSSTTIPETVSTDFDVSDVLVFEPPGADEVEATARATNARGVMLAFGGQTAINLAGELTKRGIAIVGSDQRSLDMAEDREKFDAALERLGVARPQGACRASVPRSARDRARDRLPGPRAAVVRAGRPRHGDRLQRRTARRRTSRARRRSRPARRCSSTSTCAASKSRSTRSSTATTS